MKKTLPLLAILVIILCCYTSCKKDDDSTKTCNLSTSVSAPAAMQIVYTASHTGDGSISTLTYTDRDGSKTISNPSLPWTQSITATEGMNVSISATGTVSDGSLTVALGGSGGGHTITQSDFCSRTD